MGNDIFSVVIELNKIRQQAYEIYLPIVEELKSKEDSINVPQLVGDLSDKELFSIPWGHHRAIIDKCKLDREKSIFL